MDQQAILGAYSDFVIENSERPKSIALFAKHIGIEEASIYDHFTDFEAIESAILKHFVENATELTNSKNEEEAMPPKERLITFYFTLIEVLKANRTLVLFILPNDHKDWMRLRVLKGMRSAFAAFMDGIDLEAKALNFIPDQELKEKALNKAAWAQFCSILLFWKKDDSQGFQRTDMFIEKNLRLSFELTDSSILESFIDLGKFMMNRK